MGTPAVRFAFVIAFGLVAWGARRSTRGPRLGRLERWAGVHGYRPAELPRGGATAMLRQRPQVLGSYAVPLGAATGTLCDFTISTADGDVEVTAVIASVGSKLPRFGVYDRAQFGHQGPLGSWVGPAGLDTRSMRELTVESAAFGDRYQLLADQDSGDVAMEEVLTPELVEWWTKQGDLGPSLEYEDGTMTVARRRCSDSAAELDRLVAQAVKLADRISATGPADA